MTTTQSPVDMPPGHDPGSDLPGDALTWLRARSPSLAAVPFPGSGRTWERWSFLASVASDDASRARLVEGHLDALAILTELDRSDLISPESIWGVWAAEPQELVARRVPAGWHVSGRKRWCSGSVHLDRALVTATSDAGPLLFVIPRRSARPVRGSWRPTGMVATVSETIEFDLDLPVEAVVGTHGSYVDRVGFWHGGAGVAACWYGAGLGVAAALEESDTSDVHVLAARGRARARLAAARATLEKAASEIDADPVDIGRARFRSLGARVIVEDLVRHVIADTSEALGAGVLTHDPIHSRRIADATVYLRQLRPAQAATELGRATRPGLP